MKKEARKPINDFLDFYKKQTFGKKDDAINWVSVGYLLQEQICYLYKTNPKFVQKVLLLEEEEQPEKPEERMYVWANGWNFSYISYTKEQMESSYSDFMEKGYTNYCLENTGVYGDLDYFVPYLSYAYYEKKKWKELVERMELLLY